MSHAFQCNYQFYSLLLLFSFDRWNETVSLGDTAISLHTPAPTPVILEGGGTLDQLKFKVPQSGQVFIFGGRGYSGHHIPQILEWGHSKNFEHKIFTAQASYCITDSFSHTRCVETKQIGRKGYPVYMIFYIFHPLYMIFFFSEI